MLHVVIMAGGSGTRFWPSSRVKMPKQLLNLTGDRTMIQQTWDRCQGFAQPSQMWVVTNMLQASEIKAQLPLLPESQILVEPVGRNTAPCLALAALHLLHADPEAIMLSTPSDQVITQTELFSQSIRAGLELIEADDSRFALFGIKPTYPATGFGYIEEGEPLNAHSSKVKSFKEKPDLSTAQRYLDDGHYSWNSGIFMWKAKAILEALKQYEPSIIDDLEKLKPHLGQPTYQHQLESVFPTIKSISIDYAVLERSAACCVIKTKFPWDDAGSWEALARLNPSDAQGNTIQGKSLGLETNDCIIRSSKDHLIATYGVSNLIIVHTPDATLVADRSDDQAVKRLVEELQKRNLKEYL